MSIELNIYLLYWYFQQNQCLNIKKDHDIHSIHRLAGMVVSSCPVCPCIKIWFDLIFGVLRHFQQYFSYIMATSFSSGRSRSTRREPLTIGKQLVNFITCGCESSAPFFWFTQQGATSRRIGDTLVWVVR